MTREKRVNIKLLQYEAIALCKFLDAVHNTRPGNLDMESKLIIACCSQARLRVLKRMIEPSPSYSFSFPRIESLGMLQALQRIPGIWPRVDNLTLKKIQSTLHQAMV